MTTEVFSKLSNSLESGIVGLCPWAQVTGRSPVSQGLALTVTWSLILKVLSQLLFSAARFCTDTRGLYELWLKCMWIDPFIRKPKALNQVSQSLFPINPGKTSEDFIGGKGGILYIPAVTENLKLL